jgi:hypothetical protein
MDAATAVLLYLTFCASLLLAYHVMKFTAMRREVREKARQREQQ